jgi:hypothetical protein
MSKYLKVIGSSKKWPFIKHLTLCLSLLTTSSIAATQQTYYVSPDGSDSAQGTLTSPFKTITKVRDVVRTINDNMTGDIIVYIRGGDYPITETIQIDESDSGTNGYRVYYQAYESETPIIHSATLVSGWSQHSGNIYKASLTQTQKLRTLYVNGERAYMASQEVSSSGSWGTYTITAGQASWAWISGSHSDGVTYSLSSIPTLSNATDVEIMNKTTWNTNIVTVRETVVEDDQRVLKLSQPYASIAMNQNWGAFSTNGDHTLSNAYEFLDSPGEFYLDRTTNTLYYYLNGEDMSTAEVYAPQLGVLLNVEGDSPTSRVENVTFDGITFAYAESELPEVDGSQGKSTVQAATWKTAYADGNWHNDKYTSYDVLPGAINVNHADSVSFENGAIKHVGNEGINFTNDVVNSQIVGNAITDIGGSGINIAHPQHVYIGDGGSNEKYSASEEGVVQDILISNNLIYQPTRLYSGHAAITAFFTDGLVIENNQIQDTKYSGVSLGWGWNNFAEETIPTNPTTVAQNNKFNNNRVYNVMTELHDGGAFYTLGSQPNSEASGNYVKAPTINFQGVYHPDEGTAWYTGTDLVFEIVPGQDNFELNTWRDKHDNNYSNIYSTSSAYQIGAPNSTITNLQVYPTADWPQEALDIIANAGLAASYQHLLAGIPDAPEVPGLSDSTVGVILEAEDATLLGVGSTFSDAEASGGLAVENIHQEGAGIVFSNVSKATGFVVNYTSKKSGTYSIYLDGVHHSDFSFTSTGVWSGSYVDSDLILIDIPEGSTLKLQNDSGDSGINIDYILLKDLSLYTEAENAQLYGGASVETEHAGYSGDGFVGQVLNTGDAVQFDIETVLAGEYLIDTRYAMGTFGPEGDRTLSVYVNNTDQLQSSFTTTTEWDNWTNKSDNISLLAGENTIKYQLDSDDSGYVNLDYIRLIKIYEAEEATLAGLSSNNNHTGYNGFGFVDNIIDNVDSIEFSVYVATAGDYTIHEVYAMGFDGPSGDRTMSVYVNGIDALQSNFTSTGDWAVWATSEETLTLQAGYNTIKYQLNSDDTGWINLDYIAIEPN